MNIAVRTIMTLSPPVTRQSLRKVTNIVYTGICRLCNRHNLPSTQRFVRYFTTRGGSTPNSRLLLNARYLTKSTRTVHSTNYCFSSEKLNNGGNFPEEIKELLREKKVELENDDELNKLVLEIASDFDYHGDKADERDDVMMTKFADHQSNWKISSIDKEGKTRGHIFNIEELVEVLQEENVSDICVIKVPKEKQYVDYFVIVSCRSVRHLQATTQYINQMYKQRKSRDDAFVIVEGKHTDDWMCMDLGNIVVHLFLKPTRELYELEKLWTLGAKYDDQLRYLIEQKMSLDVEEALNDGEQTSLDVENRPTKDGEQTSLDVENRPTKDGEQARQMTLDTPPNAGNHEYPK